MSEGHGHDDVEIALAAVLGEQESERQRLGNLIHDRPLQVLAAAGMQIDALLVLAGVAASTEEELRAVQTRIRAAGRELRELLVDLVPLVDVGSLQRVLERRLEALPATKTVQLADLAGLTADAALAVVRTADDLIAAGAGAWREIRVLTVDRQLVVQAAPAADAALELGPLTARVRARFQPHGGTADATEGPEGPSLAAALPLG